MSEAASRDTLSKSSNESNTTQVLSSLAKEIGRMATALEEMVDYSRATASNTRNTYQAVS